MIENLGIKMNDKDHRGEKKNYICVRHSIIVKI